MNAKIMNKISAFLVACGMALASVTLSVSINPAYAQSGSRICVNEAGTYAFEIKKGRGTQRKCEDGEVWKDYDSGWKWNWGSGRYMTCESFARDYLDWDWDVCQEMPRHNRKIDWSTYYEISTSEMYKIASLPRDFGMKSAGVCGAGASCILGVDAGRDSSFGYTAGASVSPGDLFSFDVSFTATDGASAGWSYSCVYNRGHEMGMRIEEINTNQVYSAFDYDDLFNSTHCYTRRYSDEEKDKELALNACRNHEKDTWHQMYLYSYGSIASNSEWVYLYNTFESFQPDNGANHVDYGVAKERYDEIKATQYNYSPMVFSRTGNDQYVDVHCGPELKIVTDEYTWRDGYSKLKWSAGLIETIGWEYQ